MPTLTDLSTIRDLCARYDFALSKGFGQNFIINPGICPRIAEAAGIGPGWGALEVGPGIGPLTQQLCRHAKKVVAVEIDRTLQPVLAETMAGNENLEIIFGDILKTDIPALVREEFAGFRPMACANLPYYITSPVIMKLLEDRIRKDGKIKEGNVLKVDSFLNHQMDIDLFDQMGEEFKKRFAGKKINKILTIEASGIGIACIVATSEY